MAREAAEIPHPRCFAKRGCKLLKTKDGRAKTRTKRRQVAEDKRIERKRVTQRALRWEAQRTQRKITGGNADRCENKGVAKKGIQNMMKIKELKIDGTDIRPQRRGGRRGRKCAEEWESDGDGGLETACCPFFGREVEVCGGGELRE